MAVNKRQLIRKLRRLAASCDPETPEREFAARAFLWCRNRLARVPAISPAELQELIERQRPDQDDPAPVTSLTQAREIFDTIIEDEATP